MILTDIFSMILRVAELVFGAIVAGITGHFLHQSRGASAWDLRRFIYAEVVAGLSILFSLIWLIPFSGSFIHWPVDLVLSICWFVVFGLVVNWLGDSCGYTFDWSGIGFRGTNCGSWKANEAFSFLSAICWLVSALLGIWWVHRKRRQAEATATRRRWYRRSRV